MSTEDNRKEFREGLASGAIEPVPGGLQDLTQDLHGHAIDYANDLDRRYFEEHPEESSYIRLPVEHEFCAEMGQKLGLGVPACEAAGVAIAPPDGVLVKLLGPGVRSRQPITKDGS